MSRAQLLGAARSLSLGSRFLHRLDPLEPCMEQRSGLDIAEDRKGADASERAVHRNVSDSEGITANEISLSELSLEVVQVFMDPSVCVGSALLAHREDDERRIARY